MDWFKFKRKTNLVDYKPRECLSVHRNLYGPREIKSNYHSKRNRHCFNNRHHLSLFAIVFSALCGSPSFANDIGGISATANPVANSSGSVTNQAIQVLQGPYITNTYGNGIQCQGPTLNVTPYYVRNQSWQDPYEAIYMDPVYDSRDINEDGIPDNPGSILYHVPTRTGQKDQHNWNAGVSATISWPLDFGLQRRCKEAADTQIAMQRQLIANKRLDFELARLKNCGELKLRGIIFHPKSPYHSICADIIAQAPPVNVRPHKHKIISSTPDAMQAERDSDPVVPGDALKSIQPSASYLEGLQLSSPAF